MVAVGRLVRVLLRRPGVQRGVFAALGLTGATAAAVFGGLAAVEKTSSGRSSKRPGRRWAGPSPTRRNPSAPSTRTPS